jgi:hypothetical protein
MHMNSQHTRCQYSSASLQLHTPCCVSCFVLCIALAHHSIAAIAHMHTHCTHCTALHTINHLIKHQQELNDIVFDQMYAVSGEEMPVKLPFSNTIFVMEDIDAASPIVQSRDRKKEKSG